MAAEKQPKRKRAPATKTSPGRKKKPSEERYLQLEKVAYFKAEKDGFRKDPTDYWLEAERDLDSNSS